MAKKPHTGVLTEGHMRGCLCDECVPDTEPHCSVHSIYQAGCTSCERKQPDAEREERCPVCDWPMAKTLQEGCIPGNCSYRPNDPVEQERIRKRREDLVKAASQERTLAERICGALRGWTQDHDKLAAIQRVLAEDRQRREADVCELLEAAEGIEGIVGWVNSTKDQRLNSTKYQRLRAAIARVKEKTK